MSSTAAVILTPVIVYVISIWRWPCARLFFRKH